MEKQADVKHFTLEQTQAFLNQLDTPYTIAHWGRTKKDGIITKAPKTFSSNRTVALPAETMSIIRKYKAEQQRYRLSLGTYWKGSNYLFIQDDGKQMDISTSNKVFKKVIRIYNETHEDKLPEITLHGLQKQDELAAESLGELFTVKNQNQC